MEVPTKRDIVALNLLVRLNSVHTCVKCDKSVELHFWVGILSGLINSNYGTVQYNIKALGYQLLNRSTSSLLYTYME
jgi:hypothetical protein